MKTLKYTQKASFIPYARIKNKNLMNMNKYLLRLFFLLALVFALTNTKGQTTFSGTGNWSDAARWSSGFPTSGTAVTIASGAVCTINAPGATCASIAFATNGTNSSVTISGSNQLTVSGAITYSAPTADSRKQTIAVGSGTLTCGSITMANSSANSRVNSLTISTGTVTVNGNITCNSNNAARNTIVFSGAGTLNITGSFTFTTMTFTPSTGTVNYNGTTQTIANLTYYNLQISNSGTKTLQGASTVNGTLTFSNGLLALGANDLTLTATATVAGSPSATAMVVTNGSGQFIKTFAAGASTFTFPIGDNTGTAEYSPFTIAFSANAVAGRVGVNVVDNVHPNTDSPADYISRYWHFTTTSLTTYTYTTSSSFTYLPADVNGTESNMRLRFWNDHWNEISTSTVGSNTVNTTTNLTETTAPLNGNDFTAGTQCGTYSLPYSQGFNSVTIPTCWTQQSVVGASPIKFVASSTNPTTAPQEGLGYVYWNSQTITDGNETRLISPALSTLGMTEVTVDFYFYNDNNSSTPTEGVLVQYSTDGSTWTDPGTFYARYLASSGGGIWNLKSLTLPSGAANQATIYVGFKFHSDAKKNCSLDNLTINGGLKYYSQTSGDATVIANWNTEPAGGGSTPPNFTDKNQFFIIQSGHTMTTNAVWTVSGTNSSIEVQSGGKLVLPSGFQVSSSSTANFNLMAGATLEIRDANGITSTAATGSIQTTGTRTFDQAANYIYSGTANQATGNQLPSTVNNLTINNTGTSPTNIVSLTNSTTVSGTLTLTAGTLAVGGTTLTLNGPNTVITAGNLSTTSLSNLSFGGSSTGVFIPSSVANINALTINNTNGVSMNSNVDMAGNLILTTGILNTNSYVLKSSNTGATIPQGSPTSYIQGSFSRVLNSGSSFYFPVGNTASNGLNLFTLNSLLVTNGTELKVTFAGAGAATTDGTTLQSLAFARNWQLELVGGTFTSTSFTITNSDLTWLHQLGYSDAQSGAYILKTNTVPASGSITTTNLTTLPKYFAIGTPAAKTYYSYQNGNWNSTSSWTLDPSGTTYYNPYTFPTSTDNAYIINGRTITATANANAYFLTIEYGAVVDLSSYSCSFGSVSGTGLMRIKSLNFPGGDFSSFISSSGGTIEYYDVSGNLPAQYTYNNLLLTNSTASNNNLVLTNPTNPTTYTLNGNFEMQKNGTGTLTCTMANALTNVINFTLYKDFTVGTSCSFLVGAFNINHSITLHGNLTSNGTFNINNNTDYLVNSAGASDITFTGATDNTAQINSNTRFYTFYVNKGVDKTPILHVYSTGAVSPFKGYGNAGGNASGYYSLSLVCGTLKLGDNVNVPSIVPSNKNYDMSLPEDDKAGLWLSSNSTLTMTQPMVVYGKLRVSDDAVFASSPVIVTRFSGEILIEGGTTTTNQFRPSVNEAARGSFTITGGVFNVKGPQHAGGYAIFDWQFPETSFKMTGGTINVKDQNATGSVRIRSTSYEVTGGNFNVEISKRDSIAKIESTVPFWNLNISRVAASAQIAQLSNLPLVVYNKLSIVNGNTPTLDANNLNVTVGGDFVIDNATTYTPGNNTTTFNGTTGQEFQINGTITSGLQNLTLSNTTVTVLTGSNDLIVNDTLTINSLCSLEDGGKTITAKGTVYNAGTHSSTSGVGKLFLNGTTNQAIQGDGNGIFGNIELSNSNGATFAANQIVVKTLTLTTGILDIGIYKLSLYNNSASAVSVTSPDATKMIRTSGNRSDGGVLKVYSAIGNAFTFPVGTGTVYAPATITTTATTYGQIIVKPVAKEQPYATGTNNKLQRYWKVESEYFSGVSGVSSNFNYIDGEAQGSESSYYAAVYNPYSWTQNNNAGIPFYVDNTNNLIYFTTSQIDGEYTAGETAAFPANVTVFYSKVNNGIWSTPSTWSNSIDRSTTSSSAPMGDNPVIIGGNGYNHTILVNANGATSGSLELNSGSVLDLGTYINHNLGVLPNLQVGGTGTLRLSSATATAQFPAGDFGTFLGNTGGLVEYYTSGTSFTIPTASSNAPPVSLNTYYNLNVKATSTHTITMPNIDLTVYNDVTAGSSTYTNAILLNATSPKSFNINKNLNISGGQLQFQNGAAQTLTVGNDVTITNGATFEALNSGTACANSLAVWGNITNNGTLKFLTAGTRYCNITFKGNTDNAFTGTATATTLNNLTINKGTNQTAILTMNVSGTILLTNSWLTISNGTCRFEIPSKIITLTNVAATKFTIPATACLSVNATGSVINIGNIANDASDLILNGKLDIKLGTINVGQSSFATNNDIEYASAGSPEISIESGGVLLVNGQIRNDVSNNSGVLIYNQTGGNVTIWGRNYVATKSKLSIFNSGSIFNMSGGTLTIKTGGGTSYSDLYLHPETSSATGGTIIFDATSVGNQTFKIDANVPVFNLSLIGATSNASTVNLNVNPLVVSGTLSIDANSTLNANNLDVKIGVNFSKYGTYTPGTNTTVFNGTGSQDILCNSLTTFYNLTIDKNSGVVNLLGTYYPTVTNVFSLLHGNFDTKANNLYVNGNVVNSATHISTGSGSIILNSGSKQYISGDGNGRFANLILDNGNNVTLSSPVTITQQLNFLNGMFYIGSTLLTFSETAPNPWNITADKYIITNGVISDAGIRKLFPIGNSSFTFKIGSMTSSSNKYTPITYTAVGVSGTSPYIQVRPINSKHVATNDAANKELNYYWNITASSGFTATSLTHEYTYLDADAQGDETVYVGGRLPTGTTVWQADGTVTPSANTISFTNYTSISGDYTAGESSEFSQVCTYRSRTDGNWIDYTTWEKNCGSGYVSCTLAGDYPNGNPVIIQAGHTVTATTNGYSAISLQLEGTLNLQTYINHNFISMTGAGRLKISPNGAGAFVFPAGDNSPFMNTTNSTIEYYSTSGSTISPIITTYQNLVLSGSGAKSLANVNLTIKGDFTLAADCGQFSNSGFDKNITLYNNWINNSTLPYDPGFGTVYFNGTSPQTIGGSGILPASGETFYNVEFNNLAGVSLSRNVNVQNDLTINSGSWLSANTYTINIQGDWNDNAITGFVAGSGTVNFNGTATQTYFKANGETFNNLTIGNTNGLTANCNTALNGILNFAVAGKLFISSNLFTFNASATATNAGASQFIQTNGLASDEGVMKTVSSPYNFTFPLGVGTKFTQVNFTETGAGGSGTITVIPVNSKHPNANNNLTDELQYYWIVEAGAGLTPAHVTHTYTFSAGDVLPNATGYVSGRFYNNQWSPILGNEAGTSVSSPTLTFSDKNYISGDYTCGVSSNFSALLVYYSRDNAPLINSGAAWRTLTTWSILGHDDNVNIPNTLPNANPVIIKSGHKVVSYENGINISSLTLNGNLQLNATSNHSFGSITGTGQLSLKNNTKNNFVLPTANITTFTSASGGTIEYSGVGNVPSLATYKNVIFSGSGTKNLPNLNLTIYGNLQITGGQLNNGYAKDITMKGDWTDNVLGGGFVSLTGNVLFNGTSAQKITTNGNEKFYNLEINNSNGLTLQSPVEITNNLILTQGIINTDLNKELTLSNSNSTIVSGVGLGTTSFISGPLNKSIGTSESFTFPIGSGSTYSPATISNVDADVWQAQFYLGDYNSASMIDPIVDVSSVEYWRIKSTVASSKAIVTLPYAQSGIAKKWVLAEYSSTGEWKNDLGSTLSTVNQTVTSVSQATFNTFSNGNYYSIGSTNLAIWIGGVSDVWFNANNWSTLTIPTNTDDVRVPTIVDTYMPNIAAAGAVCRNIAIFPNTTLTITNPYNLDVWGNWTNNGTFTTDNATTVSFKGITKISGSSENSFGNIEIVGKLTAPLNANINVAGNWFDWSTASSSFSPNGGTVTFNGATTQTIEAPSVYKNFYNFTVSGGSSVYVSADTKLTVNPT